MKVELDLTTDEINVLVYVVSSADSPYAADPLKDIYELGNERPADPYQSLESMAKKLYRAAAVAKENAR